MVRVGVVMNNQELYEKDLEVIPENGIMELKVNGYECVIKRTDMGYLCGYVFTPKPVPTGGLAVHGGITTECMSDFGYAIGFDCAHMFDWVPNNDCYKMPGRTYKNFQFVVEELDLLTRQLEGIYGQI